MIPLTDGVRKKEKKKRAFLSFQKTVISYLLSTEPPHSNTISDHKL